MSDAEQDVLDDELPPDIPDISDPAMEARAAATEIPIEVEAPPSQDAAGAPSARRLAPPPKPIKRPSPTSPGFEAPAVAPRKPTVPPEAPPQPIFARPGAPLGAAIATPPAAPAAPAAAAAKSPLSATQPMAVNPLQQQPPPKPAPMPAKIPIATQPLGSPAVPPAQPAPQRAPDPALLATQPLAPRPVSSPAPAADSVEASQQPPPKARRLTATQPETPAARLPLPTPVNVTPVPSARSSDPPDVLRRVAEPPRPRSGPPRPGSEPPRPGSSPALGSDSPPARAASAPIDVRAASSPPAKSPPPVPTLPSSQPPARTPSAPIDIYDPRPPPAPALPTGLGPPLQAAPAPIITDTAPAPAPAPALRAALRNEPPLELEPESSPTPSVHEDHAVVSEPKATAIMAMRIIVVGESSRVQLRSDMPPPLESSPPPPETFEVATLPPEPPAATAADTAEELAEEDVAPDSEERVSVSEPTSVPPADDSARRPPPPPRRAAPAAAEAPSQREKVEIAPPREKTETAPPQRERKETLDDSPRGRQRRPWWEELFGEDFIRATKRLSEVQVRQECTFIEESLGVAAGGVVLDLGCGAGHHAVELASRGYGVVGYDLSLFQLALAADVAQEKDQRLNFLQGDMREMAFEEMFDGVYCWNTTFGYFEEEKNVAVAQRVFKALRPGGMFLLDVANRDFVVAQSPSQVWYEGEGCVCMDDMNVDFITSRLRVKRSVILDDGRTRECNYSIRLYALHELGKLLHEVGFRVTEASGHPSMPGVFFGQFSPRIIILAQRP